jgi:hypothetical protein
VGFQIHQFNLQVPLRFEKFSDAAIDQRQVTLGDMDGMLDAVTLVCAQDALRPHGDQLGGAQGFTVTAQTPNRSTASQTASAAQVARAVYLKSAISVRTDTLK